MITNQRVLFLERVLFFYESRHETPLEAVQSISTSSQLFGRVMTFGDVIIRTYTGEIKFPHVEAPPLVIHLVEEHIHRIRSQAENEQKMKIEQTLRRRIQTGLDFQPMSKSNPSSQPEMEKPRKSRKGFSPPFAIREVTADTITYRTHWCILIQKTMLPFLLFAAALTILILRLSGYFPGLPIELTVICAAILSVVAWGWYLYEFMDWWNDIYIITPDQVIDINRKPLGLEEKRSAPLKIFKRSNTSGQVSSD